MKIYLLSLFATAMKLSIAGILLQCVFLNLLLANKSEAQRYNSVREVYIPIDVKEASVQEVFKAIELKTNYHFTFDENLISQLDAKISYKANKKSVAEILLFISKKSQLRFLQVNENINVIENHESNKKPELEVIIQGVTITGKITSSEDNEGLPGVNVIVKGTTLGSVSDINGNYSLEVPGENSIVVYSSVGYESVEVTVGSQTVIDILMSTDVTSLEELVVVGYGTAKRKNITGAVAQLKLEDSPIALTPSTNALQALQGAVAGVNVGAQVSPGRTPSILVRGQNSINGSNDPLIVLDGIIYIGSITDINPDDIAVIDVLKDASAAAVYGSRSANGVIQITSKQGKSEKPIIKYSGSFGTNSWPNPPDMMNLERWTDKYVAQNPAINSPDDIVFDDVTRTRLFAQGVDTDWMGLISQNGVFQNHQVSVSGKSNKIGYYFSGGYSDNNGAIVGDDYQRISVRSRLDADITDWLEVGLDGTFNNNDYSGVGANINNAYLHAPHGYPYRWESMPENVAEANSTLLEKYPTGSSIFSALWGTDGTIKDVDKSNFYRLATYALFKVPKVDGLTYRFNYSINANSDIQDRFYYEDYYVGEQLVQPFYERYSSAELSKRLSQANGWNNRVNGHSYVMDNIINYNNDFGDHYVDATFVATRDYTYRKLVSATGSDYASNGNTLLGVDGIHKATIQKINLDVLERANIGYLGRVSYAFKDKYHFTASIRRDGSSVFGADKKWGNFPSIGVAWTTSQEEFMSSSGILNYLKIKASYGKNGNQGVVPYSTLAKVSSGSDGGIRYEFGDAPSTILYGVEQTDLANPNLGWETTTAFNGGFQSAWFDNRVSLDLDIYFSNTQDQIFERQIPIMTGFTSILSSLGQVDNQGIEINLKTINISKNDFTWSSGLIYWQNRNKVASLYGDDIDGDGKEDDDLSNGLFIGKPLGAIYGYDYIGVVQEDDTEYIANVGAVPGDPKFKDISGPGGVPDGLITADYDRKILGYRSENFRLSFTNTVEYKNFSLYVLLTSVFGGGKDKYYISENPRHNSFWNRFDTNEIDHDWWTPENKSEKYLRPDYTGNRYLGLQSRSFVRIQDVNLSYKFPGGTLSSMGVNSIELYASVKNLYVFTDWFGGGDPESSKRAFDNAIPFDNTYPVPRIYSMGLKISF